MLQRWSLQSFGFGADLILLGVTWSSVMDVERKPGPPVLRWTAEVEDTWRSVRS